MDKSLRGALDSCSEDRNLERKQQCINFKSQTPQLGCLDDTLLLPHLKILLTTCHLRGWVSVIKTMKRSATCRMCVFEGSRSSMEHSPRRWGFKRYSDTTSKNTESWSKHTETVRISLSPCFCLVVTCSERVRSAGGQGEAVEWGSFLARVRTKQANAGSLSTRETGLGQNKQERDTNQAELLQNVWT